MKASTIRRTVDCPFCGVNYTFKSDEKLAVWRAATCIDPLHEECKKAARLRGEALVRAAVRGFTS